MFFFRSILIFVSSYFIFTSSNCFAQKLKFKNYSSRDGLLSDEVYNLHQDNKGYIWIFTNYGVLKYNGKEFKQVLTNLPFSDSFIYCIYENKAGKKWVANSKAKIYEIRNDSAFVVKGTEKTSEVLRKYVSEIYQLHADDSLNLYALTKRFSYKFIKRKNDYEAFKIFYKDDTVATRIFEDNGRLYKINNFNGKDTIPCGGMENIKALLLTKDKSIFLKFECNLSDPRHFKKFGNSIYYSHHNKLVKLSGDKISVIPLAPLILNFTKDKNNHLWVCCYNNGLYELDENDSIINHYFDKTTINDVLVDSQNGLWVSSESQGIFYCQNLNDNYYSSESLLGKPISLLKVIENELFIANTIGDIFKVKNNIISPFISHDKEDDLIDFNKRGNEYIQAFRYSMKFTPSLKDLGESKGRRLSTANKILWLSNDSLIMLSRKHVCIIVRNKSKQFIDFDYRTYSCEMRNGKLLVSTEKGVWILENKKLVQPAYLQITNTHLIRNIIVDSLKNYWFCSTGGGLFKLDKLNKITQYTSSNKLPGDIINNISFSGTKVLLSTNDGLYYDEKGDFLNWTKKFTGCVDNALFYEGNIYVSTKKGLIVLNNGRRPYSKKTHFNTSLVKINNEAVNESRLSNLKYNENNLEFSFDLLTYNNEKYDLSYYLQGVNSDSGVVNADVIVFKKLSPGSYTLTVNPIMEDGKLLQLQIPFTIMPAFWQKPAFIMLIILLMFLALAFMVYLLFKFLKKKELKKTEAERLILEYKLIALKAQINPHFMSNCLSAIQNLLLNNKLEEATDYLAKFGQLVRQILNFSTRSLITIKEELEIARLNLELEQLRFEKKFNYHFNIQSTLNTQNIFIPALILNPIIENAIWHGLLPLKKSRVGELEITIYQETDILYLIIKDNGVGRKQKAQQLGNTKESKGIKLTEQRLNNINYLYSHNISTITYIDLFDNQNNPAGTEVVISVPVNLKPVQDGKN